MDMSSRPEPPNDTKPLQKLVIIIYVFTVRPTYCIYLQLTPFLYICLTGHLVCNPFFLNQLNQNNYAYFDRRVG